MDASFFLLAAFGAMLCWGVGDFLIQKSVRKIGDVESLFFIGLIGFLGVTPFVLSDIGMLSLESIVLLVFLGLIASVVAIFNFEALKRGKISGLLVWRPYLRVVK